MVRLLRPHDQMLLALAPSKAELGPMFVRPQEFYESPSARFRGKFFTLDAFKRYYRKRWGRGSFSYYADFGGYNIPGEAFIDWQTTFAGRETEDEQKLLTALGALPEKCYLIGAVAGDAGTLDHELSHAFFYLFPTYRYRCLALLGQWDAQLRPLRRALRGVMYRPEVLDDECVSYLLHEVAWVRRHGVKVNQLAELRAGLAALFADAERQLSPRSWW